MTTDSLCTATYARLIARELQLDSSTAMPLLAGASLLPKHIFQINTPVSPADQAIIILNALRISNNPAFGLQMGSHLHGDTTDGVLTYYQNICGPLLNITLKENSAGIEISLAPTGEYDTVSIFLIETLVTSLQNTMTDQLGQDIGNGHLSLGYPPPTHSALYAEHLRTPFEFNAPYTQLTLPATPASKLAGNSAATRITATTTQYASNKALAANSCAMQITKILRNNPGQLWTLNDIAGTLNISARTLMRRLQNENTRYQKLLDAEQQRLARIHLNNSRHTVESVAAILGYHDVSTFRRAFKRWFGIPPSEHAHHPNNEHRHDKQH